MIPEGFDIRGKPAGRLRAFALGQKVELQRQHVGGLRGLADAAGGRDELAIEGGSNPFK